MAEAENPFPANNAPSMPDKAVRAPADAVPLPDLPTLPPMPASLRLQTLKPASRTKTLGDHARALQTEDKRLETIFTRAEAQLKKLEALPPSSARTEAENSILNEAERTFQSIQKLTDTFLQLQKEINQRCANITSEMKSVLNDMQSFSLLEKAVAGLTGADETLAERSRALSEQLRAVSACGVELTEAFYSEQNLPNNLAAMIASSKQARQTGMNQARFTKLFEDSQKQLDDFEKNIRTADRMMSRLSRNVKGGAEIYHLGRAAGSTLGGQDASQSVEESFRMYAESRLGLTGPLLVDAATHREDIAAFLRDIEELAPYLDQILEAVGPYLPAVAETGATIALQHRLAIARRILERRYPKLAAASGLVTQLFKGEDFTTALGKQKRHIARATGRNSLSTVGTEAISGKLKTYDERVSYARTMAEKEITKITTNLDPATVQFVTEVIIGYISTKE